LGVDSIDNCSGAQSGALDPINGMFWAWNTGYIYLKMEGISPFSHSNGNMLEYHIGGYRKPNNCSRIIIKDFSPGALIIGSNNNKLIVIKADVASLFNAKYKVDFSALSSVTDFHNASLMADNYSQMFTITDSTFQQ
jgi:hypothetical protein